MFNTKYARNMYKGEENDGPILVETAGYVPAKVKIESMINAGYRLQQSRNEDFDYSGGEKPEDMEIDPSRNPNFDLADATAIARAAEARIVARRKEALEAQQRAAVASEAVKGENSPESV